MSKQSWSCEAFRWLGRDSQGRAAGEGFPGRLTISSDGRLAASFEKPNSEADFNKLKVVKKTIKVFGAETARLVNSFGVEVSEEMPGELAFSPDGRKLAFHDGEALRIFDLTNGSVIRTFTLNDKSNLNLDFSRDGNMIAARAHHKGKTLDEYPYSLKL